MVEQAEKGLGLEQGFAPASASQSLYDTITSPAEGSLAFSEPAESFQPSSQAVTNFRIPVTQGPSVAPSVGDLEVPIESINDLSHLIKTPSTVQEKHYRDVLQILLTAKDLGVDTVARSQIEAGLSSGRLPQLICRDLLGSRVLNRIQVARATARANKCREIMSFLDIPAEALELRNSLDARLIGILRRERIIPISLKKSEDGLTVEELHLAHDKSSRDMVLENQLSEFFQPNLKFFWHFSLREVSGAYWLAGERESIDTGPDYRQCGRCSGLGYSY